MRNKKFLSLLLTGILTLGVFGGCASSTEGGANSATRQSADSNTAAPTGGEENPPTENSVTLKGLADLVPHKELIDFVAPKLAEQGIIVNIVETAADPTWNEKVNAGEVDFNFFQHNPYLLSENEAQGFTLVNAGDIHVEPIAAYSDTFKSTEEVPDGASIVIPNDGTNEYRALRILEIAGFIKIDPAANDSLSATTDDITENTKNLKITELDSKMILAQKDNFDLYVVNTNKALEGGIDVTKYLFREGEDSPYANIIAVKAERADDPAIKALVEALRSDDTKQFILDKYNGAVIPAK